MGERPARGRRTFAKGFQAGAAGLPEPTRGGIAFYFDPAHVQAVQRGETPPPADSRSEQYSLAALLYELFTGASYLDFSLERVKAFRQIVEDEPLAFARHGRTPWPEVERVLQRALRKQPDERYPSVAAFAQSLRDVAGSAEAT
jgi:serine/threonine-protein kinase